MSALRSKQTTSRKSAIVAIASTYLFLQHTVPSDSNVGVVHAFDKNRLQGAKGPQTRIVGGDTVSDPTQYPYFVDLLGCGGSLIGPRVVLTAAHCDPSGTFFLGEDIRVGALSSTWSTADGSIAARVVDQANHPQYDDYTVENDFMLLLLDEDVDVAASRNVDGTDFPILMLSDDDETDLETGNELHVLGVGTTSEGGPIADTLMDAAVEAFSDSECLSIYGPVEDLGVNTDNMFCAGIPVVGGKDSCQGDSGGPIVRKVGDTHIQVGVTSWGIGCADAGYPGVYSRVSSAKDWIKQVVCEEWERTSDPMCDGFTASPTSTPSPTATPTASPPPTMPPTDAPLVTSCSDSSDILVDFSFTTDDFPTESTWQIFEVRTGRVMLNGGDYFTENETDRQTACLPTSSNECYVLSVNDNFGDGFTSTGSYQLTVDGTLTVSVSGAEFLLSWMNHNINC